MGRVVGILMCVVVACGLLPERPAFGQESLGGVAPTSPCPNGWEPAFEHAQTVTVWIETYFTNGTGVLLSKDIVAAPARLVAHEYGSIEIRFSDDTTVAAEVVYVEPVTGLALLKLERPAPVAPPNLADVTTIPLLGPLLAVTQPRKAYTDPKSKYMRAAPQLVTRGKLVDATTFTVRAPGSEVLGAPVFGCDAGLYGVVVQHDGDGTLVVNRRALLDAIVSAITQPYAGQNAYWFEGAYVGFGVGPNPKFGVMFGFEVFYFRRFLLKASGGYGLDRTEGGLFAEVTAGYRWALPRTSVFVDLDVGAGVGRVDIDARRKLCVAEDCAPVGTATRGFLSGRFAMTAGLLAVSLGGRVDPKRGEVGPVAFVGIGVPTEFSDAYRNHE